LDTPVEDRLHPARPARFERRARDVQPHVAAAYQDRRRREVVVFEVYDALRHHARVFEPEQTLKRMLGLLVAWMRLAGQHHLHGTLATEQRKRPLGVAREQLEPLVRGDTPGEADRQ